MTSVIKTLKKDYGIRIREARKMRHNVEKMWKEMKRDGNRDESKHKVLKRHNHGHRIWSIEAEDA